MQSRSDKKILQGKLIPIDPVNTKKPLDLKDDPIAKKAYEQQELSDKLKRNPNLFIQVPKKECLTPPNVPNNSHWKKIKSP